MPSKKEMDQNLGIKNLQVQGLLPVGHSASHELLTDLKLFGGHPSRCLIQSI